MPMPMASVRAVLLLLPPFSVLLCMAVRCLCRVAARKLTALARAQFACPPSSSSSSFRYLLSVDKDEAEGHRAVRRELPVALYRRPRKHGASSCAGGEDPEPEECVFCLSGIEEGEEIRELKCRHLFHRRCLDRWLLARPLQATCPLCRGRLLALASSPPGISVWAQWEAADYYGYDGGEEEGEEDSDMMLFMACVHSRSSWLWPS